MKIIKRVRYQRVSLADLGVGDHYKTISGSQTTKRTSEWDEIHRANGFVVLALDTDRYPPEVTWDVVGVPHEPEIIEVAGPEGIEQINVYKGGIETIYE